MKVLLFEKWLLVLVAANQHWGLGLLASLPAIRSTVTFLLPKALVLSAAKTIHNDLSELEAALNLKNDDNP